MDFISRKIAFAKKLYDEYQDTQASEKLYFAIKLTIDSLVNRQINFDGEKKIFSGTFKDYFIHGCEYKGQRRLELIHMSEPNKEYVLTRSKDNFYKGAIHSIS